MPNIVRDNVNVAGTIMDVRKQWASCPTCPAMFSGYGNRDPEENVRVHYVAKYPRTY